MDIMWIATGLLVLGVVFALLLLFTCGGIASTGLPAFPCPIG